MAPILSFLSDYFTFLKSTLILKNTSHLFLSPISILISSASSTVWVFYELDVQSINALSFDVLIGRIVSFMEFRKKFSEGGKSLRFLIW